MKPIEQMNLTECLAAIRKGDYLGRHDIVDRIQQLTRWTPLSERLPTEIDGDKFGAVWVMDDHEWSETLHWKRVGRGHVRWKGIDRPEEME